MSNAQSLADALRSGDIRSLARAATLVENRAVGYRDLLRAIHPHKGQALIAGITGPPGAGKSTLTSALAAQIRSSGRRVAVLAVDPSSPFTGGAILGDRIRMLEHAGDDSVYIRSMATRGAMGGLAPAAFDICQLLDAAGFHFVLLETVGAGQDEVDVARIATVTVVVLAPGMGDDVQAIKAGILEIADVYALNKADTEGIERLERDIQLALELSHWQRTVCRVSASKREGIGPLLAAIEQAAKAPATASGKWQWRLEAMYREAVTRLVLPVELEAAAERVASGESDPYTVIEEWLARTPGPASGHNKKEN